MSPKEPPLSGLQYEVVASIDDNEDYTEAGGRRLTDDLEEATVITSRTTGGEKHKIVLDIDLPAKLIPSSTEGHFHLFIDKEISELAYFGLLEALRNVGVLEDGYVSASLARGHTAVRLPWVRKGAAA
ncbi:hypothetical protein [Microbacterium sp. No. 7]|uniref:hypothetical protein n=1 Tax=Microbacterium sp. No. 7 TaxID=1714373 RepID=UPI0006D2A71B|nr:hypothetical protein [Microbacterium sp. No. 7]ALJ19561.1 hypothetical protein AOA12_06410 [Microbacterium sp. No. 7]